MKKIITLTAVAALLAGCSGDQAGDKTAATEKAAEPAASQPAETKDPHVGLQMPQQAGAADPHAGMQMPQAAPVGAPGMSGGGQGVIKGITQAGAYSYVEVESGGNPLWIAVGRADFQPGDEVAWRDGAVMRNFHSKTLDRDFEAVMFVSRLFPAGGQQAAAAPAGTQGVVVSVQNSGGYSYVELDTETGKTWLAVPGTKVDEGSRVSWQGGSEMRSFYSKSLDRTFDSIWFISALNVMQ